MKVFVRYKGSLLVSAEDLRGQNVILLQLIVFILLREMLNITHYLIDKQTTYDIIYDAVEAHCCVNI